MRLARHLPAALLLALCLPLTSAPAAEPVAAAPAEAAARVVIFDRLMDEPPEGLAVLSNAARALENEFKPRSTEIDMLSRQYEIAQRAVPQAQQAGTNYQTAVDRAEQLGRDLQRKSDDAAAAYQRRQSEVIGPLVKQIDEALQRYQGDGEVFLISQAEFYAQPEGTLSDVTAAFVSWMATQP